MARNHLKRKLETYQALAWINQHFEAIARHVFDLEHMGFFSGPKMHVFQGLVRELQSQISHDVCNRMHAMKDEDMFEFGKVRIARDHSLNPDRPAFPAFKDAPLEPAKPAAPETPNPEVPAVA